MRAHGGPAFIQDLDCMIKTIVNNITTSSGDLNLREISHVFVSDIKSPQTAEERHGHLLNFLKQVNHRHSLYLCIYQHTDEQLKLRKY